MKGKPEIAIFWSPYMSMYFPASIKFSKTKEIFLSKGFILPPLRERFSKEPQILYQNGGFCNGAFGKEVQKSLEYCSCSEFKLENDNPALSLIGGKYIQIYFIKNTIRKYHSISFLSI